MCTSCQQCTLLAGMLVYVGESACANVCVCVCVCGGGGGVGWVCDSWCMCMFVCLEVYALVCAHVQVYPHTPKPACPLTWGEGVAMFTQLTVLFAAVLEPLHQAVDKTNTITSRFIFMFIITVTLVMVMILIIITTTFIVHNQIHNNNALDDGSDNDNNYYYY